MYKTRHLEQKVKDFSNYFKIVLITGARQVGKSTLLEHVFPDYNHVTFDPVEDIYNARKDPDLFLDNFPAPIILDEIQYAPELLPALKRRVDKSDKKGQYFLTGSQNIMMMKLVAESMAGRVGIIELPSMSLAEMNNNGNDQNNWVSKWLKEKENFDGNIISETDKHISRLMWRGSLPGTIEIPDKLIPDFYNSYINTYIERDVRKMENISELSLFHQFVTLSAALSGQEINTSQLGRDINISRNTARRWLDILIYGYQWFELPPYFGNTIKRISGKKKGYFSDTGIICTLQKISSPESLMAHPMKGSCFETFVVNSIIKNISRMNMKPAVYHWRTNGGAEVDMVLEIDGKLFPLEIKLASKVTSGDSRGIRAFRNTYPDKASVGIIVYSGDRCFKVNDFTWAVPCFSL